MIDIQLLRDKPEIFKKGVKDKQHDPKVVDEVLKLDKYHRKLLSEVEELRAKRNKVAKEIGRQKTDSARKKAIAEGKKLKETLQEKEPELKEADEKFNELLKSIPNPAASDVKVGKDESENEVIRTWGKPNKFSFKAKDHVELGELLGVINIEKASRITGPRFGYLMGEVAMMEFALIQFAFEVVTNRDTLKKITSNIDKKINPKPFIPVVPPVMIKPEVFDRMARLNPKEERYYIPSDDIYLIGSAEHTLGPLHMDETLSESDLPLRYVGFSTAFRREAGSYGKDTRGILRVHQFDKVEMETFALPEEGQKEQDLIIGIQEYLVQSLGLPYQVIGICTGDMGAPDYRQVDINTWMPGQDKYRETHTSDYMTDYQSRRLGTKYRLNDGTTGYVYMNDATTFAVGRMVIAILENYQQEDGSVVVPEVLRKWMGKEKIEARG